MRNIYRYYGIYNIYGYYGIYNIYRYYGIPKQTFLGASFISVPFGILKISIMKKKTKFDH